MDSKVLEFGNNNLSNLINDDLLKLVYKKYKDYGIEKSQLISLLKKVIFDVVLNLKDDTMGEEVLVMQELDKQICLYLKSKIINNDIDSEILIIDKYKYIFNKINSELTELEKEEILIDAIKCYDGTDYFSRHAYLFIKQKLQLNSNKKIINISSLKQFLKEVEAIEDIEINCSSLDILYSYYYDIEDILTSNLNVKEKIIILLKFGYINHKFYSDKTISNLFGFEVNEVKKIYNSNIIKLKENYYEEDLKKQYIK